MSALGLAEARSLCAHPEGLSKTTGRARPWIAFEGDARSCRSLAPQLKRIQARRLLSQQPLEGRREAHNSSSCQAGLPGQRSGGPTSESQIGGISGPPGERQLPFPAVIGIGQGEEPDAYCLNCRAACRVATESVGREFHRHWIGPNYNFAWNFPSLAQGGLPKHLLSCELSVGFGKEGFVIMIQQTEPNKSVWEPKARLHIFSITESDARISIANRSCAHSSPFTNPPNPSPIPAIQQPMSSSPSLRY